MNRTQFVVPAETVRGAGHGLPVAPRARLGPAGHVRPIRSGDCDAIRVFFAGLSPRTRYLRFFSGAAPATAAMLRVLCGERDDVDVVVAAEGAAIIGHAMAVHRTRADGTRLADLGVVVADEWQDRGIGTALMRIVTGRALAMGASMAVMDVLAENRRMLALIKRRWPEASYELTGISVTVHARLQRCAAPAAGEFSQPQRGRRGDNDGQQARHPAARVPVGGSRHLRRCGA